MLTSLHTRLKRAGRWLPVALLSLGSLAAQAQTLNYTAGNAVNTTTTYTDLGTTGTAIATANNDDANSAAQNIGFTFSFNGTTFTQFVLSTNGFIKLGATSPSAANLFLCNVAGCTNIDPVTSTDPADVNLIMPFNFDLQQGTGGAAEYRVLTSGTAPNRVCTIQWKNVSDKPDSAPTPTQYDNMSFQAKLYETTNNIEFVYAAATPSTAAQISRFPVVGIKGSGSGNGQTVLGNKTTGAAPWSGTVFITGNYTNTTHNIRNVSPPDAGRTYRFVPTAAGTCGAASGITATNVTTTSATIGFTPVSGATSYTVTYTPAGGTATTVTPAPTGSPINLTGLTAGTAYTVSITTNCAGSTTSSPATFTFTTSPAAPSNDNCANATALTTAASCTPVNSTNDGATASPSSVPAATCATAGPDVWFSIVVPAGGAVNVTTSASSATGNQLTDTVVQLYSGTCGSLTPIGCNDDATANYSSVTATGLTAATTIYARVFGFGGATGNFAICATVPPAAPANDNPAGAITLPLAATCTPTNATNVGATTTTPNGYTNPGSGCGVAVNPKDVWFTFTTAASGAGSTAVGIQVTGTAAGLVRVFSAASAAGPFTQVGCSAGTTNNTQAGPLNLTGLTPNTTYYVFVSGYGSNDTQGAFTICAVSLTACAPVTNLTATNVTTTGATITFTAPTAASTYSVTYTPAGGTATTVTPAPTGSPITLTGLTSGTTYTVAVTTSCGGGSQPVTTTTTFTTVRTNYCNTGLGGFCGGNNVTAVAIANTTLNTTGLTCTSGGTPAQAYTAYPATGTTTAALNTGTTYTISVAVEAGSSVSVWVDYNRNLLFEANEYVQLTANSATPTVTGSLVVPATASLGQTGLRIRTRLNGNSNSATDACVSFGSGETKDFTVTLRNGTSTRNEALAALVGLAPNPAHQSFQLTVPAGSLHDATATLRNALGQVVQTRQLALPLSGGTADFNVSSLAAGVYTLTLKSGNDFVVKRVVVE